MKRAWLISLLFVAAAILASGHSWGQSNPVVQWQSVLSTINQIQAEITALQQTVGTGSGGSVTTLNGATILDVQPQTGGTSPYFQQVAAQNTANTIYTFVVPGGTLGTNRAITLLAHLQYVNTVSADTPSLTISYGSTNIVGGALAGSIAASASPSDIWLQCDLSAVGQAAKESGICFIIAGHSQTMLGANDSMTENSANALPLSIVFNNTSSGNSTISAYAIKTSTGAGLAGTASAFGSSFNGTFTGALSLNGTGGTGITGAPINSPSVTANSLVAPFVRSNAANPAASGFVQVPNSVTAIAARNSTNTGDFALIGPAADNRVHIGGPNSQGISLDSMSTVNNTSLTAPLFASASITPASWTGGVDKGSANDHWLPITANAILTLNYAAGSTPNADQQDLYYIQQPASGTLWKWQVQAAAGARLLWSNGGTLPAECDSSGNCGCTTNGCIDEVRVVYGGSAQNVYVVTLLNTYAAPSGVNNGCPTGAAHCYYVDSVGGLDTNAGTFAAPWQNISKVVSSEPTFAPGTYILFKAGNIWTGQELDINQVYGTASAPIVFTWYGAGVRPIFDENNLQHYCVGAFDSGGGPSAAKYVTIDHIFCEHAQWAGIAFKTEASTTSVPGMPGIVISNSAVQDTGNGCSTVTGFCLGTDDLNYRNQLEFLDESVCANPTTSTGQCVGDGVQMINDTVKWCGGHNCFEVHYDEGAGLVSGVIAGPGSPHENFDVKGVGHYPDKQFVVQNSWADCDFVDSGSTVCNGQAAFYTENTANPAEYLAWRNNIAEDAGIGFQVSPGWDGTLGGSSCKSGECDIHVNVYNSTSYTALSHNAAGIYTAPMVPHSAITVDDRNNILDGTNNAVGGITSLTEDYNNCGGSQGTNSGWANNCLGAHDRVSVNPLYVSANTNTPDSGSAPNFGLQAGSPMFGAGLVGLTPGCTNIGICQ